MELRWKPGYHAKVDVVAAHEAIETIRNKNGGVAEPEHIVKAAKAKSSPLHAAFDWDDSVAANEWRLNQARSMLRSIQIVSDKPAEQPRRVFEVKRLPATENKPARNVYSRLEDIMADPEARAELLARALRELLSFRQRYRQLQELAVVMRSVDEVLENVEV